MPFPLIGWAVAVAVVQLERPYCQNQADQVSSILDRQKRRRNADVEKRLKAAESCQEGP